ncbi:hypothetical protein JI739_00620 [Ramlibacter sp. AW1]|uniref:Uncharacterized protein n=1 Tax=Ramlibacter aurantiacus TaxID=2801330 RepID=A0A937D318_9BURK|nr:hypothetical protein [Ramlibacter aurantiacus]MBL0418837.1 hypothetical protein [Ramlibacter aurantiacus]
MSTIHGSIPYAAIASIRPQPEPGQVAPALVQTHRPRPEPQGLAATGLDARQVAPVEPGSIVPAFRHTRGDAL